jgi:hypothetical protein
MEAVCLFEMAVIICRNTCTRIPEVVLFNLTLIFVCDMYLETTLNSALNLKKRDKFLCSVSTVYKPYMKKERLKMIEEKNECKKNVERSGTLYRPGTRERGSRFQLC